MGGLIVLDLLLALTVLSAPAPALPGDTIVELRRGDRVILENVTGEVGIASWGRDLLEVRTDEGEGTLVVRRSGATVRITRDDRKGRRRQVEATIRVPAWVDLEVGGPSLDLFIEGMDGRIEVRNVEGEVTIRGAGGPVFVRTVEGEIDVSRATAGVDVSSQSDDIRLSEVSGTVSVHSGSGDLQLLDIRSSSVRAETQDGDIRFSGEIQDGGAYRFFVHDGDAIIAIPPTANARVAVSTFDGEFESDFPVLLERFTGGRKFDFTIGSGRATIEIQVFDGEIHLVRR